MSMLGTGADNKLYNSSTRFQSGQIGIGIPLFYGSRKARINASRTTQLINENSYLAGLQALETDYAKAITQYTNASRSVDYYESVLLANANLITSISTKQFANGEINYLQWVMLTNQAIMIRNDYLNAVNYLNESIIQLTYYMNK